MALSPQDRIEINDLYARYAYEFDRGSAADWVELFTANGRFGRLGEAQTEGREALVAFRDEERARNPGVTHHTTNVIAAGDGDSATGRAYVFVVRSGPETPLILRNIGLYEDRLVRQDGTWLFEERIFQTLIPPGMRGAEFNLTAPSDGS